jgi:hypothetical protein
MSDILIGVIVFGLVFGAAIFGMFLGRNLRVLEQKVNTSDPPSLKLQPSLKLRLDKTAGQAN